MLPQMICYEHAKEIVLINLNKICKQKQRTYCPDCCKDEKMQLCFLDDIPSKITALSSDMVQKIQSEYSTTINNVTGIMKSLSTLKDELIQVFDKLICQTDQLLKQFNLDMENEQHYYKNLLNDMTRNKLNEIAEMLVGNKTSDSKVQQIKLQFMELLLSISTSFKELIKLERKTIIEIQANKYFLSSFSEYQDNITVIDSNLNKRIIIGGVGRDIIVWKYDLQFKLQNTRIKTGYLKNISSIKISIDGTFFLSACQDFVIKLWVYQEKQWKCKQTINNYLQRKYDIPKFYQFTKIDTNSLLFYCQGYCYCIYKITYDETISLQLLQQEYFKIENQEILEIQFTQQNELIMLIFEYQVGFQICQYNLENKQIYFSKFQLSSDDLGFFPKYSIEKKVILKIPSYNCILIMKKLDNGKYILEERLSNELVDFFTDVRSSILIRNNQKFKRIELYQVL